MIYPHLVHYHIYKNAGSSIDRLLQYSFGETWATFEGTHAADVQSSGALTLFLDEHKNVRAVSSHLARPPLPFSHDKGIVMLRHPIDRALSVYSQVQRDPTQPDHQIASTHNLAGYVRWALDNQEGFVIKNYQVIHLSEASFRYVDIYHAVATNTDLQQATEVLSSLGVFGLVRRFAHSCELFMRHYRDTFPELQMFEIRENATQAAGTSESDAIERVHAELGHSLYQRLVDANDLDIQLYIEAAKMFEQYFTE